MILVLAQQCSSVLSLDSDKESLLECRLTNSHMGDRVLREFVVNCEHLQLEAWTDRGRTDLGQRDRCCKVLSGAAYDFEDITYRSLVLQFPFFASVTYFSSLLADDFLSIVSFWSLVNFHCVLLYIMLAKL